LETIKKNVPFPGHPVSNPLPLPATLVMIHTGDGNTVWARALSLAYRIVRGTLQAVGLAVVAPPIATSIAIGGVMSIAGTVVSAPVGLAVYAVGHGSGWIAGQGVKWITNFDIPYQWKFTAKMAGMAAALSVASPLLFSGIATWWVGAMIIATNMSIGIVFLKLDSYFDCVQFVNKKLEPLYAIAGGKPIDKAVRDIAAELNKPGTTKLVADAILEWIKKNPTRVNEDTKDQVEKYLTDLAKLDMSKVQQQLKEIIKETADQEIKVANQKVKQGV